MQLFGAEVDTALAKLLGQIGNLVEAETLAHKSRTDRKDSLMGQEIQKIEAETAKLRAQAEKDNLYMKSQAFTKAMELIEEAKVTKDAGKANELRDVAKTLLRGF